jgi:hypothetical protein
MSKKKRLNLCTNQLNLSELDSTNEFIHADAMTKLLMVTYCQSVAGELAGTVGCVEQKHQGRKENKIDD